MKLDLEGSKEKWCSYAFRCCCIPLHLIRYPLHYPLQFSAALVEHSVNSLLENARSVFLMRLRAYWGSTLAASKSDGSPSLDIAAMTESASGWTYRPDIA